MKKCFTYGFLSEITLALHGFPIGDNEITIIGSFFVINVQIYEGYVNKHGIYNEV